MKKNEKLPVTVLSGFLGAGKLRCLTMFSITVKDGVLR